MAAALLSAGPRASKTAVTEAYGPVGARAITVASTAELRVGDRVVITRPSTAEWVSLLGMNTVPGWRPENRLHGQPGSRDIAWDRNVVAIDGHRVTLDAPLTTALDPAFGAGQVTAYAFAGRLSEVGVEFLRLVSASDPERRDGAGLDEGDYLNGPEYQRLFDTLWKGSAPMHYRVRREYRDRHPDLVLLREGDPETRETAQPEIPAAATGEVVAWNIDNLESIGGHPVQVMGAPEVVDTPGGRAVRFDGVDDGLFVESNPLEGLTRFTVEVEFLPDADGPPEQRFLHFEEASGGTRALIETRLLPGGTWCLDTFLRDATASLPLIDRTKAHAAGAWHTAALTYDGTTMAHYVDGVKELEGAVKVKRQGPGRVSIGVRQNLVYWFKGQIRRVKITPDIVPPEKLSRVAP